ncbi:MAG TPA: ArsI/CadI family heavy metal resistance metalloenzyme [Polyangiaceae bacterium LLY-WYZ-15_(1-7)]|nr:ArsI/CadI family heavy metal resistance metalloenzyme [Polyangiaceae bacterium LLY-WYZ-15_(1-7)]HJL03143.1 ArsI/CadI family heavy metal resistance metalloenzyme [Polyangiaceae bacterium LLY-WYZ-15_(1-7)]HJL13707.1 ArsI/CadI family heavy metal resistance metalloenzyme [Polyangiaceae bacterium LLY-WYZ-15_(1-7)]HJL27000.1 ArsI/CadI family heavy metal resistance metalloenzyme [Polyangiaceae bacterium LLY-WYZ-15_(1-7)]HJL29887.1 ArsI/CadI family heavy metal resistance metalloenzyme [Polyangiaceae
MSRDTETSSENAPTGQSAVEFPTAMRAHVALAVKDLEASLAFYERLFQQAPTKRRPGYAKFEVLEPPLNLTLNEAADARAPGSCAHFGIQVKSTDAVVEAHGRMRAAGFATMSEEGVTCCFAVQDKIWVVDPDGHRWEVFVVLDADTEVHSLPPKTAGERLPANAPEEPAAEVAAERSPCCG